MRSSRKAWLLITIFAFHSFSLLPSFFSREEKEGKGITKVVIKVMPFCSIFSGISIYFFYLRGKIHIITFSCKSIKSAVFSMGVLPIYHNQVRKLNFNNCNHFDFIIKKSSKLLIQFSNIFNLLLNQFFYLPLSYLVVMKGENLVKVLLANNLTNLRIFKIILFDFWSSWLYIRRKLFSTSKS